MFFAIVASRVYKRLAAIAPNESVVCGYYDDGHFMRPLAYLAANGDAMPEAYASVGLTVTIRKKCCIALWVSVMLSITYPTATSCGKNMSPRKDESIGGAMGTSDFARDVFDTALSKNEAYGERPRGLAAHRHSRTALRFHQHGTAASDNLPVRSPAVLAGARVTVTPLRLSSSVLAIPP
jgi:hypothetical protein